MTAYTEKRILHLHSRVLGTASRFCQLKLEYLLQIKNMKIRGCDPTVWALVSRVNNLAIHGEHCVLDYSAIPKVPFGKGGTALM